MTRPLAVVLFLFEPFLAASLLLRAGPSLLTRDPETVVAFVIRIALALASVAAAIGLRDRRPYAHRLTIGVLAASAAFAVVQYVTRALPTSLAPGVIGVVTAVIVLHHTAWVAWLLRPSARSFRRAPGRERDVRR